MAEFEELQLQVTLEDNATPGLQKLRQELAALGGAGTPMGKVNQGVSVFERELDRLLKPLGELGRLFKPIGLSVANIGSKLLPFAGSIAAVGTSVLGLGFAFKMMVDNASEFSKQMITVKAATQKAGVDPADYEKMSRAFQAAGVSAEAAERNIMGLAEAQADLTRNNSQLRRELISNVGLSEAGQAEMGRLLDDARQQTGPGFAAAMRDLAQKVRALKKQEMLAAQENAEAAESSAAESEKSLLERIHAPDLALVREALESASEEEKKMAQDRIHSAEDFNKVTADIAESWEKILDVMGESTLTSLVEALDLIERTSEAIADILEKREQEIPGNVQRKRDAEQSGSVIGNWWNKPAGLFGGGEDGAIGPAGAASIAKEAQTSAEASKMLLDFAGTADTGKHSPFEFAASGTRGDLFEGDDEYEKLGRTKYDYRGGQNYGGGGSGAPKTVVELAAEMKRLADNLEAVTGVGPNRYGMLSTGVVMRGLGGLPGMGKPTGDAEPSTAPSAPNAAPSAAPSAPSSPASAAPGAAPSAASSRGDVGPGTAAAGSPTPGNGEIGPAAALAIARQHLGEDEIRDEKKLSEFFHSQQIKISPRTTAWCAAFVNTNLAAAGVKGTGSLAAYSFLKWGQGVNDKMPVQAGDVAVPKGYSHVEMLTGETKMINGVEYVKEIGGNQGGTVSGRGGVSERWIPRSSLRSIRRADETMIANRAKIDVAQGDRSQIDNDMTRPVDVGGKVTVNVNAPPRATVTAESGGMFNKTEVNRTMPMETAGPG